MGYLSREITNVASIYQIPVVVIDEQGSLAMKKALAKKFSVNENQPQSLSWQNLSDAESYHDSDSWRSIGEYVGNQTVLLFVNPEDEQIMWKFNNGNDLNSVLEETTGFPFCVTSSQADYILCFEDYDCLLGKGSAAAWVKELREKKQDIKANNREY